MIIPFLKNMHEERLEIGSKVKIFLFYFTKPLSTSVLFFFTKFPTCESYNFCTAHGIYYVYT